jgi:hypothetical protein
MADQINLKKNQLLAEIETAWVILNSYLANLSTAQKTNLYDSQGWCVKDHITHITAWEESVVFFLQGKPRHEALGVEEKFDKTLSIDELNAVIQKHSKNLRLSEAMAQMQATHRQLVALLAKLTDADLDKPLNEDQPEQSNGEARLVIDLIRDNTSGHFSEHLDWIETLASKPG